MSNKFEVWQAKAVKPAVSSPDKKQAREKMVELSLANPGYTYILVEVVRVVQVPSIRNE